jgi:hypothetical protein
VGRFSPGLVDEFLTRRRRLAKKCGDRDVDTVFETADTELGFVSDVDQEVTMSLIRWGVLNDTGGGDEVRPIQCLILQRRDTLLGSKQLDRCVGSTKEDIIS